MTDSDLDRIADMPLNAERAAALRALGDRAEQLERVAAAAGILPAAVPIADMVNPTGYSEPREIARLLLPISVTAFTTISDALDREHPGATVGSTTNGWLIFRRPPPPAPSALPLSEHDGG